MNNPAIIRLPAPVGMHQGQLVYVTDDGQALPATPTVDQFVAMVELGLNED